MKTAYELLMTAPDSQQARAKAAFKAIANGQWADAAFSVLNAANEELHVEWAENALELAEHCERVAS